MHMQQPTWRRPVALVASLALTLAPAQPVLASGFQLVEQNASGLGNAYAGQAAAVKDASAIYFNPAALTRIPGKQLVVAVNTIGIDTKFTDGGSTRPSLGALTFPVPTGGDGGQAGAWVPVPNGYLSYQAGKTVWLGLGFNAPFGLKTDWDSDWRGRFHGVKSEVRTYNLNPTLAVKVSDQFSLGFGASYQKLRATLTQNVPYGGIAVAVASQFGGAATAGILAQLGGPSGLAREGLVSIEGDDWTWGYNLGANLQLGERGRLGVSYRSRIKHEIAGAAEFGNAPTFATAGPLGALGSALNARFVGLPVTAKVELPDTLSIAAAYEGEKVELLGDWTRTGWSTIQALDIVSEGGTPLTSVPLNFEDTWRVGLGGNVKLNDDFKLRLGVAYDKAPVQDRFRTPRLPDNDRTWIAAGFEYKLSEKSALDLGAARLFIKDASSSLPNQDSPTASPKGALVGSYSASVNIVSLQFRQSF